MGSASETISNRFASVLMSCGFRNTKTIANDFETESNCAEYFPMRLRRRSTALLSDRDWIKKDKINLWLKVDATTATMVTCTHEMRISVAGEWLWFVEIRKRRTTAEVSHVYRYSTTIISRNLRIFPKGCCTKLEMSAAQADGLDHVLFGCCGCSWHDPRVLCHSRALRCCNFTQWT